MPKYDYQCQKCQLEFELSLSLEEREKNSVKKVCPSCSSSDLRQILLAGAGGILRSGRSSRGEKNKSPCGGGGCAGQSGCPYGH